MWSRDLSWIQGHFYIWHPSDSGAPPYDQRKILALIVPYLHGSELCSRDRTGATNHHDRIHTSHFDVKISIYSITFQVGKRYMLTLWFIPLDDISFALRPPGVKADRLFISIIDPREKNNIVGLREPSPKKIQFRFMILRLPFLWFTSFFVGGILYLVRIFPEFMYGNGVWDIASY